jgi:hypothetical protein
MIQATPITAPMLHISAFWILADVNSWWRRGSRNWMNLLDFVSKRGHLTRNLRERGILPSFASRLTEQPVAFWGYLAVSTSECVMSVQSGNRFDTASVQ